ncbi:MAG: hypothetical protein A2X64_09295 [Ignavibacteria bacterium GWF2_33_9]|nr:MAG: hypothetical protein A2X64_09295 [Ignavibacteria bacterium GWF2_33_9]
MLKIYTPTHIFDDEIITGITLKNDDLFPPFGFSISQADIFTEQEVVQNRKILANELGFSLEKFIYQKQIHSNIVNIAKSNFPIYESDGLITNEKELILVLSLADCCGIMVYDNQNQVIGAFHSGWKGTKLKIAESGIEKMVLQFGSKPGNLKIWLTPSAGGDEYEVGKDVAQFFPNSTQQISDEKWFFDNKKEILFQMLELGIQKENIEISPVSTISDKRFHSYRRDKNKSGRMAAFICLKNS